MQFSRQVTYISVPRGPFVQVPEITAFIENRSHLLEQSLSKFVSISHGVGRILSHSEDAARNDYIELSRGGEQTSAYALLHACLDWRSTFTI